jgi:methyl-accepting chemotaxis protein
MDRNWSFGRRIFMGFGVIVALTLVVGVVATNSLFRVIDSNDRVLEVNARGLVTAQRLETAIERRISALRGYLISREQVHLAALSSAREDTQRLVEQFIEERPELRQELDAIAAADAEFRGEQERMLVLMRANAAPEVLERAFVEELRPKRERLSKAVASLAEVEDRELGKAKREAEAIASSGIAVMALTTLAAAVLATLVALVLTRTLGRQISTAVGQVQSSSAELQASANQQAAGLREQATAMAEITTTISELLATSRQIAESAQRVAQMASQTAGSARSGDETVSRAHDSIAGIQRQVELIVGHMLELGRKSQQIGTVLEIVSELAEQTNILAINATIEATGAGESGRRFAVVADEIRRLADRVTGSTKEIRSLIDEVRSAVNTTVMATETGSKTVEAGSRQFNEVATSLRQISGLVGTTTEAAREIELSTKQQSTAVEQVNVAISNVAQASRETEASAAQTLQTASQLAQLSKELLRVVQPEAA